jgi:hypothetical protein
LPSESMVPPVRISAILGKLAMTKSFLTYDCNERRTSVFTCPRL